MSPLPKISTSHSAHQTSLAATAPPRQSGQDVYSLGNRLTAYRQFLSAPPVASGGRKILLAQANIAKDNKVQAAQSALTRAREIVKAIPQLEQEASAAEKVFEEAKKKYDAAEAALDKAQANKGAKRQIPKLEKAVETAKEEMDTAETAFDEATQKLGKIKAVQENLPKLEADLNNAIAAARAKNFKLTPEEEHNRETAIKGYREKKISWERALEFLKTTAKSEAGQNDYKTQYWIAKIANEQNILEEAFPAAEKSLDLAKNEDERDKSKAIVEFLTRTFAAVTFTQDERQKAALSEGYIVLDVDKPIINLQKKKLFEDIKGRYAKIKLKLPATVYLPFGEYRGNGAPFEIEQGKEATATVFLFAEEEKIDWLQWAWVAGAALLIGFGFAGRSEQGITGVETK